MGTDVSQIVVVPVLAGLAAFAGAMILWQLRGVVAWVQQVMVALAYWLGRGSMRLIRRWLLRCAWWILRSTKHLEAPPPMPTRADQDTDPLAQPRSER